MSSAWVPFDEKSFDRFRDWVRGLEPSLKGQILAWLEALEYDPALDLDYDLHPDELPVLVETRYKPDRIQTWFMEFRSGAYTVEVVYLINTSKPEIAIASYSVHPNA